MDHFLGLIKSWRRGARVEYVFFPTQRYLFERKHRWIDCNNMTVALYCTNVNNRSVLILTILHFWVCQLNN